MPEEVSFMTSDEEEKKKKTRVKFQTGEGGEGKKENIFYSILP